MQACFNLKLRGVCAAALALASALASADPVVADVNGAAAPGAFVFGLDNAGWKWTATDSFVLTGLGSIFYAGATNALSPSQATLLIASNTPAVGGTTLFSGLLDGAGHASFADIAITAGTSYFIGYSGLLGPANSNTAVGLNIANFVPNQAPGTVNLNGWYHGAGFADFTPQFVGSQLQVFSAPILRFEGHAAVTPAVPEPQTWALMLLGLAGFAVLARRRARRA